MDGLRIYAMALLKALQFSRSDWEKVTARTKRKLRKDAEQGILQTGKFKYKSVQYMRYKQNYFRRLTHTTGRGKNKKTVKGDKIAFTKTGWRYANTKIAQYKGVSVKSNHIPEVNMMVTGQLYQGLRLAVVQRSKNRAIMKYATKDRKKLEGNPEYRVNELSEDSIIYTSKPLDQAIRQKFSRLGKMRIKQKVQVM